MNGQTIGETRHDRNGNALLRMRYVFDELGSVIGLSLWYNRDTGWSDYYFLKSLQGDILQIYRASDNTLMAEYSYDSWGNILSATGALADVNPFRYRGYYYDTETGFYYLNSRYYALEVDRFLNTDSQ